MSSLFLAVQGTRYPPVEERRQELAVFIFIHHLSLCGSCCNMSQEAWVLALFACLLGVALLNRSNWQGEVVWSLLAVAAALATAAVLHSLSRLRSDVRSLTELTNAALAASTLPTTRALSSLSRTAARTLLDGALLDLVLGESDELREVDGPVAPWVWPRALSEPQGTPALLAHLQLSLASLGVKWGRGGYDLLDVHSERLLFALQVGGVRYVGGADGLVVPHNTALETARRQARVVVELKRRSGEGGLESSLAQAVAELVAASGASAHECILLLTDGTECDVFRLGCDCVTRWRRRSLAEGLTYVARALNTSSASRVPRSEGVRCTDPALARTLARLHDLVDACAPGGAVEAMAEQLEGLLAAEGLPCEGGSAAERDRVLALANELAAQWRPAMEEAELPRSIQHMYG